MKPEYYFDASSLSKTSCLLELQRHNIQGWKQPRKEHEYKMAYGTGFHYFLREWYAGTAFDLCLKRAMDYYNQWEFIVPADDYHTPLHLEQAIRLYAKRFPQGQDLLEPLELKSGGLALEQKFSFPYYECDSFVMTIAGTIDFIGKYGNSFCLVDHKTCGSWDRRGFFAGYDLDVQMRLYVWAFQRLYPEFDFWPGAVINGIFKKAPTQKATKEGVFDGVDFERSPFISYSEDSIRRFEKWLFQRLDTIRDLLTAQTARWPEEFSCCKRGIFPCRYSPICARDTADQPAMLESSFHQERYEPLKFQD